MATVCGIIGSPDTSLHALVSQIRNVVREENKCMREFISEWASNFRISYQYHVDEVASLQRKCEKPGQWLTVNDSLTSGDDGAELRRQFLDIVVKLRSETTKCQLKVVAEKPVIKPFLFHLELKFTAAVKLF